MIALRCFRDSQLADQLIAQQLRALWICFMTGFTVWLLLFQEKGIPLMGESSFLASRVNRRAMMMGTCVSH